MLSPSHDYLSLNNNTQSKEMILRGSCNMEKIRVVVVTNNILPKKDYFSFLFIIFH